MAFLPLARHQANALRLSTSGPSNLIRPCRASTVVRTAPFSKSTSSSAEAGPSASSSTQGKTPKGIQTPADFVGAIARPRRGDMKTTLNAIGETATLQEMNSIDGRKLREAGVPVKERRYFLWALEKYKQGLQPSDFAYDIKPRKTIRGWGARVQNGIRVRGERRSGEK